jgi:hypothetical protein
VKKLAVVLCCLLSAAAWGQRRERKVVQSEVSRDRVSAGAADYRPSSRIGSRTSPSKQKAANGIPQAPGVLQLNLADGDRSAWFVTTDVIPAGSTITAYIAPDNDNFLRLGPLYVDEDILPGRSFLLPKVPNFGIFWPAGVTTYDVVVRVNNRDTHSAADFTVDGARNYDDLGVVVPLIYQWAESIEDRQLILTIEGEFTSDPVKIVLEDLVVPREAISQNGGTIKLNLSKVPGTRLHLYQDFLLTVGQDGYTDTRIFTHVPFSPDKYEPAPRLE